LDVDFKGYSKRFQCFEEMGRHIIDSVNAKMTNDVVSNTLMLQQMSTDQLLFSKDDVTSGGAQGLIGCSAHVPDLPNFDSLGTNACLLPSFRKTVGVKAAPKHTAIELTRTDRPDRDYERVHNVLLESRDDTTRPIVTMQNCVEKGYSVINIKSKDRPKLPFDTICTLTDMQYVVFHGTVDSDGPDAFQEYYIRHMDGCPVTSEAERKSIIHCLEAAIERRISEGMRLELCSCDRVGLLSDVTRIFRENGL
ncbi:hypothetical protein KI387_014514, partial [Taxus chinensis]